MAISDMPVIVRSKDIVNFGVTDHLHTPFNLPDITASRNDFLKLGNTKGFYFGIEVSCVSDWELEELAKGTYENPVYGLRKGGPTNVKPAICLTEEMIKHFGIEYVIGGVHWPLYVPYERSKIIMNYHRQYIYLACHPLVDIVAHPWWWMGHWQDVDGKYRREPWFDDFGKIPLSIHDEFASALVEHGTAAEINAWACLLNDQYPLSFTEKYIEYLIYLKERGVKFSIGSDTHDSSYLVDWGKIEEIIEPLNLKHEDLWSIRFGKKMKRGENVDEKI